MRTFRPLLAALLPACLLAAQAPPAAAQGARPADAGRVSIQARGFGKAGTGGDGPVNVPGRLNAAQHTASVLDAGGRVYNVMEKPFGAKGDGRTLGGCSVSAGSPALTCTSGFAAADASKLLVVPGAGAGGADLSTTILSFRSATQVALAAPAATTVSGKTVSYATNDTAAIRSAIGAAGAAGGGVIFLPAGWYGVTNGALTIGSDKVILLGAGRATRIASAQAAGDTFAITSPAEFVYGAGFRQLSFQPMIRRTAGREIRADNFDVLYLDALWFQDVYDCMKLGSAGKLSVIAFVTNTRAHGYRQFCYMVRVLDFWFVGVSGAADRADSESFYFDGGCEGGTLSHVDMVNVFSPDSAKTGVAMRLKVSEYTATPPRWFTLLGVLLDSHHTGLQVEDGYGVHALGFWAANRPGRGVYILGNATDVNIEGFNIVSNGLDGIFVAAGSGHSFSNGYLVNNGYSTAADALSIGGATTGVTVNDVKIFNGGGWNAPAGPGQYYGIKVYAGAQNFFITNSFVGQAGRMNNAGGILIEAGCDYFKVDNVVARGYAGTGLTNRAGTSPTKVVGTVFQ